MSKHGNKTPEAKYDEVVADLEAHPGKRLFWRSGYKHKGAMEREISRDPKDYPKHKTIWLRGMPEPPLLLSWKDALKAKFDWACVVELESDTGEEVHLQGLDANDMW